MTREYRKFAEFCNTCTEDRYIGICHGLPGVGKTFSGRFYADWDRIEKLSNQPTFEEIPAFMRHCRTIFYTPSVANTPHQIKRELGELRRRRNLQVVSVLPDIESQIIDSRSDITELVIVDETDRLSMGSIEQLRDIHDRSGIPMVLMGMPGIQKTLSRYQQLYSRVGFIHEFKPISITECKTLLMNGSAKKLLTLHKEQTIESDAAAAIARVTQGNFRLLHRLGLQIQRVLKINRLNVISKDVVNAARESLLIGR